MMHAIQHDRSRAAEFELEPRGPFSLTAAVDVLRHWAPVQRFLTPDGRVRLTFPLDGDFRPVAVALREAGGRVRGRVVGSDRIDAVARQVARMLSLDHDATGLDAVGERDPAVGRVLRALPGLRPVCFASPYEAAAWAVLSQRISMQQAARLQDQFLAAHSVAVIVGGVGGVGGDELRCFPPPDALRRLRAFPGLPSEKIARLHAVADAALDGLLDAEKLRALGDEAAPAALRAIRGIGPFWSQGIYLRACGIRDVFPDEPLAVAALGHLHGLGSRPDAATVARLTEAHRPFRMWICFLLRVAASRGLIPGAANEDATKRRKRRSASRRR